MEDIGRVCNFLGSALPQQKFKVMDGSMLQLRFTWQAKENTSSRHEGRLTQKTEEKRGETQFWLLLLFVVSPPQACPV